jgi:hypothetical protein
VCQAQRTWDTRSTQRGRHGAGLFRWLMPWSGCDDRGMDIPGGPAWSDQAGAADWIKPRLGHDGPFTVTAVVPGGFAGYARILHPAVGPAGGAHSVRWAEVAAWSGLPLRGDSQFHSIALPQRRPAQPAPWSGQPEQGSLYPSDAAVLISILRSWTATPDQCWFCLWDGYGHGYGPGDWVPLIRATKDPAGEDSPDGHQPDGGAPEDDRLEDPSAWPDTVQDAVPETVRQGPRVQLPGREYLLYTGPVEAAVGAAGPAYATQSANLWWPQDRAWCVASEIDLCWTYVGGPAALIGQLVADQRIEALRASPADSVGGVEPWITGAVAAAVEQLFTSGEAVITTALGTVRAHLDQPSWHHKGQLRTEITGGDGDTGSGYMALSHRSAQEEVRSDIAFSLTFDVIGLVES